MRPPRASPLALSLIAILVVSPLLTSVRAEGPIPSAPRPKVGLVLSGGAARGAAHVGAIQELVAAGIPIDVVVGTSIGAIIGGLYAAGFAADELVELLAYVDPATTARSQFPLRGGVLDNAPLGRLLAAILQDRRVTDTAIPFRGIVTDLATGDTHAPSDAPLALVLQASAAVPILFNPVRIGDRHYYDGGLKQLIPAESALALGADYLIAVNVGRDQPVEPESIQSTAALMLLGLTGSYTAASLQLVDVTIEPDLRDETYMDFDRRDLYVQAGRRATLEALPSILADLERLGVPLRSGVDPNRDDPIHLGWRDRVEAAAADADPPALRFGLRLDASTAFTRDPASLSDRLGVALDLEGGPLGRASVGVALQRGSEPSANLASLRLGYWLLDDLEVHAATAARLGRTASVRVGVRARPLPDLTLGVAHDLLSGVTDAAASYRSDHVWIDAFAAGHVGRWARAGVDLRGALASTTPQRGGPAFGARLFALATSGTTPVDEAIRVDPTWYRAVGTTATTHALLGGSVELRAAIHDPIWLTEVVQFTTHARTFLDVVHHDDRTRAAAGIGVTLDGNLVGLLPFQLHVDLAVDLADATLRLGVRNGDVAPRPWRPVPPP